MEQKLILNLISNDNQKVQAEVVCGFIYNKNKYLFYSLESLGINIYKEYQKKENRNVYLAQMFDGEEIKLKGLFDDELKSVMEILSFWVSKIGLQEDLNQSDDVEVVDIQNIVKSKKIKEDLEFEPSKITASLYCLIGIQKMYNSFKFKSSTDYKIESLEEQLRIAYKDIDELAEMINEQAKSKSLSLVI